MSPIKKAPYRSQAGIIYDILRALYSEGEMPPTRITYYARLPYDRLKPMLRKLVEKGLVEEVRERKRVYYKITMKGYEALKELEKTKKLLEALGMRF